MALADTAQVFGSDNEPYFKDDKAVIEHLKGHYKMFSERTNYIKRLVKNNIILLSLYIPIINIEEIIDFDDVGYFEQKTKNGTKPFLSFSFNKTESVAIPVKYFMYTERQLQRLVLAAERLSVYRQKKLAENDEYLKNKEALLARLNEVDLQMSQLTSEREALKKQLRNHRNV